MLHIFLINANSHPKKKILQQPITNRNINVAMHNVYLSQNGISMLQCTLFPINKQPEARTPQQFDGQNEISKLIYLTPCFWWRECNPIIITHGQQRAAIRNWLLCWINYDLFTG